MVKSNLVTTNELSGSRVVGGKRGTRRIGKVRRFVFHPTEKRFIGFIVKRPDLLWMFKRSDMFVSVDGYDLIDGQICIRPEGKSTDSAAYKTLGVNPDESVVWVGLPLMDESGQSFGVVGNVVFNAVTGTVQTIESDAGATANALLGKREIPANLIKGFRKGIGAALSLTDGTNGEDAEVIYGALLVSEEVEALEVEGGLAEKAGKSVAVIADKAGKMTAGVTKKASDVTALISEKTKEPVEAAGKAINKGAYATGKQISKTKGMFSSFKDEYKKARRGE